MKFFALIMLLGLITLVLSTPSLHAMSQPPTNGPMHWIVLGTLNLSDVSVELMGNNQTVVAGDDVAIRIIVSTSSAKAVGPMDLNVTLVAGREKVNRTWINLTIPADVPFDNITTLTSVIPTSYPAWVVAIVTVSYKDSTSYASFNLREVLPRSTQDLVEELKQSNERVNGLYNQFTEAQAQIGTLREDMKNLQAQLNETERAAGSSKLLMFFFIATTTVTSGFAIAIYLKRKRVMPTPSKAERTGLEAGLQTRYSLGLLSDPGRVRSNNEDSILAVESISSFESVDHGRILCAVADGVGGSLKGEVASRIALQAIAAHASRWMIQPNGASVKDNFQSAIESANEAVVKYALDHPESEGMATTIVAALVEGNITHIAHAGDSRAYLVMRDRIERLTKDHSQVQELVDAREITAEEALGYPGRNVITRAIGAASDIEVDISRHEIAPNDELLLCTDGLWDLVRDKEIHQVILGERDPQAACKKLVSMANDRGGKDNISIIILRCESA